MKASTVALTVALSGAAFAAGRSWPRAAPEAAATQRDAQRAMHVAEERAEASRPRPGALIPAQRRVRPARAPDDVYVQGRRVDPRFLEALRADPQGANATRTGVLVAMEARRRSRMDDVRACLASEPPGERVTLRMMVDVESRETSLRVASPVELEVSEGSPISDEARDCLLAVLAGTDDVKAAAGERFLRDHRGRVDYVITVESPPS